MRILLLGATGYLGRSVRPLLEAEGHAVLAHRRSGGAFTGDLTDEPSARRLVERSAPDLIINLAAEVPRSAADYADAQAAARSVAMVRAVCASAAPILHVSTIAVYGSRPPLPVTEAYGHPESAYARGKLAAEAVVLACPAPATVLRIPGLFGRDRAGGLLAAVLRAIRGERVELPGEPVGWTAMHVDDAAAVLAAVAGRCGPGLGLLHAGYRGPVSIDRLARLVNRRYGLHLPDAVGHPDIELDMQRLRRAGVAEPQPFEAGIVAYLERGT